MPETLGLFWNIKESTLKALKSKNVLIEKMGRNKYEYNSKIKTKKTGRVKVSAESFLAQLLIF